MDRRVLVRRVRVVLGIFIVLLVLFGLTAFPMVSGIKLVNGWFGEGSWMEGVYSPMAEWITHVHDGLLEIDREQPFIFYGTDWMGFGHIVIAIFMAGALKDPVKNIWVIEAAMIACALVIVLALVCGPMRGIPFFWRLVDCAFGVGVVPVWVCRRYVKRIEAAGGEGI
jgi:hypothetical protein